MVECQSEGTQQLTLRDWPGCIARLGVSAAKRVTVLEPRLEGGTNLVLGTLWSVCPASACTPPAHLCNGVRMQDFRSKRDDGAHL